MGEMKSALERALEKAEQIGKLSPEEMQEKRRAEYIPIGEGLAKRYLEHGHLFIIEEGINKHTGEERSIVANAALSILVKNIGLGDSSLTDKALRGIVQLRGEERIKNHLEEIETILSAYHQAKQQRYEEERARIEKSVRESLHRMRISGSAVGHVHAEGGEEWKKVVGELQSQFGERLAEIAQSLGETE